jgi:hypothetical protein
VTVKPPPNKVTGANAGGPPRLPIRTLWATRIAQFWHRVHMTRRIIMLLILAALVALVVFAALPRSPRARPKGPWQWCQINLKQIELAKQMWASDTRTNGSPGWDDVRPYLLQLGYTNGQPICPKGGTYNIGALNEVPHCSLGKPHALP